MFRIECFCDDVKLAKVLLALNGLAYDVKSVPVANATKIAGHARQTHGGSALEALMSGIAKHKLKEVAAPDMKTIMVEGGFAAGGYSNALARAQEHRLLRKITIAKPGYARSKVVSHSKTKSKAKGNGS